MHLQEGYWELQRGHEFAWKVRESLSRKACDILSEEMIERSYRVGRGEGTVETTVELSA